jgi:hypothetical protein
MEHAVDAGGADGDDIVIEHHGDQPRIPVEEMAGIESQDCPLLRVFEPSVARDEYIVLVG